MPHAFRVTGTKNAAAVASAILHSVRIYKFSRAAVCILVLAVSTQNVIAQANSVTPVQGESWLTHLHRPFDETAMGKTWRLGPPEGPLENAPDAAPTALRSASLTDTTVLRGADLYRLNCQGCHGESGQGSPPEIASIIDPVRSTSAYLVLERMKTAGAEMTRAQAAELARQSKNALLQRLHNGGQEMPSFSYLRDSEIRSLIAYLDLLAGVPNANSHQVAVPELRVRVGELIVKSTCHTCHEATGTDPSPDQLAAGAIPPLSTLTTRVSRSGLIRKITAGAPIMDTSSGSLRGRMPVFFYLSKSEAADVFAYLAAYPPQDPQNSVTAIPSRAAPIAKMAESSFSHPDAGQSRLQGRQSTVSTLNTWFFCLTVCTVALLGAGLVFTVRELRRLSAEAHLRLLCVRKAVAAAPFVRPVPTMQEPGQFYAPVSPPRTYIEDPQVGL